MVTKILIVLVVLLAIIAAMLILNKKGVIKDEDNDFIPDAAEDAFRKAKKETKSRIKEVYKEAGDVVSAFKEVGNQIGDIPKAAAGKKRAGRKPKK